MTARARILAIRLLEKQEENAAYASRIGVQVRMVKKEAEVIEKIKPNIGSNLLRLEK
jgi:hypothetical protein